MPIFLRGIWSKVSSGGLVVPNPAHSMDLAGGAVLKSPPANAGDAGLIPHLRKSLGEGNGNPIQFCCLRNPTDRGAWWAAVHQVTKESDMA